MQPLSLLLILLLFTALGSDARLRAADGLDEPSAEIVGGDLGRRLDALFAGSDKDRFDVASLPFARGWHGLVVAKPKGPYGATGTPDQMAAGPWLLMGDPAELDRIASRLGLAH